jgi:hypothetical protein
MAKLPDFSEITKKFEGIVDSVKSAVSGGPPPKAPDGDEIAAKFVELITATQNLATAHAEQGRILVGLHHKLTTLYHDVQQLRNATSTSQTPTQETPVTKIEEEK